MNPATFKDATLGLGTFLYVLDTTTDTPVPIQASVVANYLNIFYTDADGKSTDATICEKQHFSDTVTPNDDGLSIYD
jgi:hypothetical protein